MTTIDSPPASVRSRLPWWVVTAYAVVLVLLIALAAWLGLRWHRDRGTVAVPKGALRIAPVYAVEISTYNYQTLDQDLAKVRKISTKSFGDHYKQLTDQLRTTFVKYKATTNASVAQCAGGPCVAIRSISGNQVVALVAVDQVARNTTVKAARTDSYRMEITLVRSGGRWLIDRVRLI